MRTPADIVRMLGWPEGRRKPNPWAGLRITPLEKGDILHPDGTITRRRPRLRVFAVRHLSIYGWRSDWEWAVTAVGDGVIDNGRADTQPAALAVGLAALEAASVHSGTHNRGTTAQQIRTEQR